MSHEVQENQGTGLRDAFDILSKEPSERLLSLTIQLGESPEENIIHALCLIILHREDRALDKLQMLKDNYLANHVAERWQMSRGNLEDFAASCGEFQELTGESLAVLARIFRVLSERRLCGPLLRNLAYQRAISMESHKTSSCENLEYDPFKEEAKDVCGPQIEEWMSSLRDLKSVSLDEINMTLKATDQSERAYSLASPLQVSLSMPSYPTHLEISIPPTASFHGDTMAPETSDNTKPKTSVLLAPRQSHSSEEPQTKPREPALLEAKTVSKMDAAFAAVCGKSAGPHVQIKTPNESTKLPAATKTFVPDSKEKHESKGAEEEEEAVFYAFVILHAPEDTDVAENLKERLETVSGWEGATFSGDFAIPGRSTLKCVEDAINNSAFTILLLTRNFNTRMVETETDTALINSINKKYKHNTVIPLLPRENPLPKQSWPLVLHTIVPLDENKNFERKVRSSLSPAKLKNQKRIWEEGQRMKRQMERQDELKRLNEYEKQFIQECKLAQSQERENRRLLVTQRLLLGLSVEPEEDGGDGRRQPPSIHIENAQYIMIGNDSQMTVDHFGGIDKDDSVYSEE
ncbi:hypothetical protein F2P81_000661 [Scophthalmus maximus]|uniref:TIR domain-containing protein n=1 Tax=Scophthalmus maximus TaxID=52904 RepID=A0A6A4TRM3_SCOMX|nr:hypothetical protein F2P81_000661 [Scophthalmus maximus]